MYIQLASVLLVHSAWILLSRGLAHPQTLPSVRRGLQPLGLLGAAGTEGSYEELQAVRACLGGILGPTLLFLSLRSSGPEKARSSATADPRRGPSDDRQGH